jgi:hypothetical protein
MTMALALGFVVATIALFVGVLVVSFGLLHGEQARDAPTSLPPVSLLGPEETVYSWARERCDNDDSPDLPARAFRTARGQVELIASHFVNRRFVGSSLNRMTHRCGVIMRSDNDPDPGTFNDREWLAAPYTPDGRTVFALVHNEFQGHQHPGRCPSGEYLKCWYNAVTLAVSTDGGASFRDARPPPEHLVAALPYKYIPDGGSRGIFSPSNIIRSNEDGYYYVLVRAAETSRGLYGTCLMRTRRLNDPRSWRAWGGSDFDVAFVNPYHPLTGPASRHRCDPISNSEIDVMHQSLTYNTFLEKYLLVGVSGDRLPGRRGSVWGVYYSVSDDLINWSRRKLIREVELPWTYECGDPNPILYPSILDPASQSRNFETSGRRPYMYFTRFHYVNCVQGPNRDLVRVRVEFSK